MPLTLIRNDITLMAVDAIVNAANTALQAGGGVCGAIFRAAGADRLQAACNRLAPIETGGAVITKGFALPAKYIIHTAGPVYCGGDHGEEALLRSCYKNALGLAKKHGCKSVAFPLISSGIYGYPKDEALSVATGAIGEWLMTDDMDVSLVVYDKAAFALTKELLGGVKAFIDENYVDERKTNYDRSQVYISFDPPRPGAPASSAGNTAKAPPPASVFSEPAAVRAPMPPPASLDSFIGRLDEPFSATLLRLIDAKGKTDVEIYKRANIDRKLFSKIRNPGYRPSKKTALALAVALELSLAETRDLLGRAGFALSHSVLFDVIVEYFIKQNKYNIFEINNVLFDYDQPLLGG